jgi:hypothetical protein
MKVTGKALNLDITNLYRDITNPVWAFVAFQTNRLNNQLKDNSMFDHMSMKNIWLETSGKRYPRESWDLDFDNDYYSLAYDAFQEYKKLLLEQTRFHMLIKKGFKSIFPIFSINLSTQPQNITNTKSNIILHAEFNKSVNEPTGTDEGTICYIILVSIHLLHYEPFKNKITQES